MGDRVGRKYTFLVTLSGMGLGTGAIGLIPTYESIGLTAAFLLFGLRMIQGLCLGGEYGGAITYAGVLPMLNTHDAHLPPFSLYENALMTMRGADRRREYEVSTLAKMVEACVRGGLHP
jgi:hypothetical protein